MWVIYGKCGSICTWVFVPHVLREVVKGVYAGYVSKLFVDQYHGQIELSNFLAN
jgi:hypothetical protein